MANLIASRIKTRAARHPVHAITRGARTPRDEPHRAFGLNGGRRRAGVAPGRTACFNRKIMVFFNTTRCSNPARRRRFGRQKNRHSTSAIPALTSFVRWLGIRMKNQPASKRRRQLSVTGYLCMHFHLPPAAIRLNVGR